MQRLMLTWYGLGINLGLVTVVHEELSPAGPTLGRRWMGLVLLQTVGLFYATATQASCTGRSKGPARRIASTRFRAPNAE